MFEQFADLELQCLFSSFLCHYSRKSSIASIISPNRETVHRPSFHESFSLFQAGPGRHRPQPELVEPTGLPQVQDGQLGDRHGLHDGHGQLVHADPDVEQPDLVLLGN